MKGDRHSDDAYCFFITPLGPENSDIRARADEIQSLIDEVLTGYGLSVIRADQIGAPGMITDQIVRSIVRSRMVFADLTGANANVYYELGVAHSLKRPVVTIIDKARNLTFDAAHDRAIVVGDDGRLSLAQAKSLRKQLAQFVQSVSSGRFRYRNVVVDALSVAAVDELAEGDPILALLTQTHEDVMAVRRLIEEPTRVFMHHESADARLMRDFIVRLLDAHPVQAGRIRNALLDGRTSAEHDEWVETLLSTRV
jgi:hypothetical protein